jgi:hypothetical protein
MKLSSFIFHDYLPRGGVLRTAINCFKRWQKQLRMMCGKAATRACTTDAEHKISFLKKIQIN